MSRRHSYSAAIFIAVVCAISLAVWGAGSAIAANEHAGSLQANKAAMLKVYELMSTGKAGDLDQYVSADMVDHQAVPGFPAGLEGLRQLVAAMHAAFPDFKVKVEDAMAVEDRVVCRITMTGTQRGPWLGVPSSGKSFSIQAIDIVRFQNGKGVEHWGNEDDLSMMQQLGMIPAEAGGTTSAK
jgi:steroid delta-isomerase-like uncharacterized protein